MEKGERGRRGKHRRRKHRDFWRAWREERRRLWQEARDDPGFHGPPFPSRRRAHFWREFFHDFMGIWPEDHWAFKGRRFSPWHQGKDEFNPFVASLLTKGGGLLPLFVLHILDRGSYYGNEIMERISQRTSGQWIANPGAIYPLMGMLEEQGLVIGEWEDPDKRTVRFYHLTEAGEQELARLRAVVGPKLQEAIEILQDLIRDLNEDDEDSLEVI